MGRAAAKRRRHRRRDLAQLAARDPEEFAGQWARRLDSWSNAGMLRRHAGRLVEADGDRTASVFVVVDRVMRELAAISDRALELQGEATLQYMTEACCKAVAQASDARLYPALAAAARWKRVVRG